MPASFRGRESERESRVATEDTRIPFVQRILRADGRVHLYFRREGHRRRLRSPEGSQALREEVDAILAQLAAGDRAKVPRPGTGSQARGQPLVLEKERERPL
jgi:hypothetical protein